MCYETFSPKFPTVFLFSLKAELQEAEQGCVLSWDEVQHFRHMCCIICQSDVRFVTQDLPDYIQITKANTENLGPGEFLAFTFEDVKWVVDIFEVCAGLIRGLVKSGELEAEVSGDGLMSDEEQRVYDMFLGLQTLMDDYREEVWELIILS